jgi:beta-glucosidase
MTTVVLSFLNSLASFFCVLKIRLQKAGNEMMEHKDKNVGMNGLDLRIFLLRLIVSIFVPCYAMAAADSECLPYRDVSLSFEKRIEDLIGRLSVTQKIRILIYDCPAVENPWMPSYAWNQETIHGVARRGRATVFPQAIGLAAAFDEDMIYRMADAVSDEARAKHKAAQAIGNNIGLSTLSPNINIFRDPRWGRGQETYGEDPYLTSRLGVQFVRGMQGSHPRYWKVSACAKHYLAHSGPEPGRVLMNATVSKKDLYETYLPAFKAAIQEADAASVMAAYNLFDGTAIHANPFLLKTLLRDTLGFKGVTISDSGGIKNLILQNAAKTPQEAAVLALRNGMDLNLGETSLSLEKAFEQGLITEEELNAPLARVLWVWFKVGMFDPPEMNPYTKIDSDVIGCEKHTALAREAAIKSMVLLKNKGRVLPLPKNIKKLFVLGPNATNTDVLIGNYYGTSGKMTTFLEGITSKVHPGTIVEYRPGCQIVQESISKADWTDTAHKFDAIIAVFGLSGWVEGEEGEPIYSEGHGDRLNLNLPQAQVNYLKKLRSYGNKPIILVLTGGSPIISQDIYDIADAVLFVWYPGEQGGNATADILFGDAVPSGRLPITFPKSTAQLPPFENYAMAGRTYRYMTETPLFPFGFGLSYTTFEYSSLKLSRGQVRPGEKTEASFTLRNTGSWAADEVVQVYIRQVEAEFAVPRWSLRHFERVSLKPGQSRNMTLTVTPEMMSQVNDEGQTIIGQGEFKIYIGGASPWVMDMDLGAAKMVVGEFQVKNP